MPYYEINVNKPKYQVWTRVLRSYEEGPKDVVLYESDSASESIQWAIDNEDKKKDGDYMRIRHVPCNTIV